MKKVQFTEEQKERIAIVAKHLFPEYKHVKVVKDYVRFGHTKKGSIGSFITSDAHIYVPIFELLYTKFPKALSMYKAGNESFAIIYSVGMMWLSSIDPAGISDYFYEKFKEIKVPYDKRKDLQNSIEQLKQYEDEYENHRTFRVGTILRNLNEKMEEKQKRISHKTLIEITQREA